jgi:RNA-binding protein YlmH
MKMNKQEILQEYKNQDDRLLVAKILDKIEFVKTKNKIQCTDFLNLYEQEIALNVMKKSGVNKFYLFGGKETTERKILIIYPEKLTEEMARKNHKNLISIIRISVPKDLAGEYDHRRYLGAIIKLGIDREKVGDIFVEPTGADIVVKEETAEFLLQNLGSLTRFQSSEISKVNLDELKDIEVSKVEISSVVISLRLDNIVSVLAKTSRSKAVEILEQERVFLNYKLETKSSKQVKVGDVITIRGKGRFEFREIAGNTKKGRYIVKIDKYI